MLGIVDGDAITGSTFLGPEVKRIAQIFEAAGAIPRASAGSSRLLG